ncbi:hypothetical protein OGATHE_006249 [Ogataea polymorpha]|uniref:Transthyretin/hydroxyisourate hydrolase domain-containing protein n=1 Tax=Ogataea polymorpha TaxID=460523 RepID=A0A9P8NTQ6_9ASCO|nr:hypothetical protein OGATHE_006249 [Ogataea polymorpha]
MPPITCHILDTTLGQPAANVECDIRVLKDTFEHFATARTNSDGRVAEWVPKASDGKLLKSVGFENNQWTGLASGVSESRSPPSRGRSSPAMKLLLSSLSPVDSDRHSNEISLLTLFLDACGSTPLLSFLSLRSSLLNILFSPFLSSVSSSSLHVMDDAGVLWSTDDDGEAEDALDPVG